ncbi:hypothetical protein DNHGIG_40620 [Collibacillus ludicampi]|uniref:Uncharacterized protein n=1 Tax=Collibacillus ludicampi TaxID=2771369 RepID=A0AAV4LL76_9BACL|nr:hypothetical protein DNHGIG_40620 [Collibacillus ludicampi]
MTSRSHKSPIHHGKAEQRNLDLIYVESQYALVPLFHFFCGGDRDVSWSKTG